jgi:hypothetical protein
LYQITKIVNSNKKIFIHHSNNVIDKRTHYEIQFDSVYPGCIDYYINKTAVQSKIPQHGQLKISLYLSTEKYLENPEKWISLFKEFYKEKFDKYSWYDELEIG